MSVSTASVSYDQKTRAIVMFGPPTNTSGFRAAEYFQAVIDPNMASPSGEYLRFGFHPGDELVGWQRVEAITVCEVLGLHDGEPATTVGYVVDPKAVVSLRTIIKE